MLLRDFIPISVVLVAFLFAAVDASSSFPIQKTTSCGPVELQQCWCLEENPCEDHHHKPKKIDTTDVIPIISKKNILTAKYIKKHIQSNSPTELDLSGKKFEGIDRTAFDNVTDLKSLDLSNNNLSKLPAFIFSKLTNLEHLDLSGNGMKMTRKLFAGLNNLKSLKITNALNKVLDDNSLFGLTKSCEIHVTPNSVKQMFTDTFGNEPPTPLQDPANKVSNTEIPEAKSIHTRSIDRITGSKSIHTRSIDKITGSKSIPTRSIDKITGSKSIHTRSIDRITGSRSIHTRSLERITGSKSIHTRSIYRITEMKICIENNVVHQLDEIKGLETLEKGCQKAELRGSNLHIKNLGITDFEKGWYRMQDPNRVPTFLSVLRIEGNNMSTVSKSVVNDLPEYITWLDLENNKIERLETGTFVHNRIFSLELNDNLIAEIADNTFKMPRLYQLFLRNNRLRDTKFFATMPESLSSIDLTDNEIAEISPNSFSSLKELRYLNLERNRIKMVGNECFLGATNLGTIVLSANNITIVEPGAFNNLSLGALALDRNQISTIEKGVFNDLVDVQQLSVARNQLTKILSGSFDLPTVERLDLSGNNITEIEKGAAKGLGRLNELNLQSNPIEKLENGAFFGLNKTRQCYVLLDETPIGIIYGGVFDDV